MLHNTKFQVIQKYAFNSLSSLLNDLYLPIVGYEAIHVYQALLCESSKQIAILGLPSDINEYLKIVNMDLISFFKVRQLLEAVGLLTTYLQNDSTTKMGTYYFQIHEPLNFNDFIANQKYRHLLIRSIGQVNYERLEHLYTAKHIPSSAWNISTPFENVFNDVDINAVTSFNFQQLYANIAVQTGTNVIINDIAKKVIEKYFNVYKLTTKEVENIINQSICTNSDNFVEVDVDLLEHQMQRHVQSIQNIDLARNIEINRNAKIFNKYCPQNELLPIFSDYKAFNAEQYLKAIIKCNLSDTDLKTIKILREKYLLNDGIINMITDLTLNRANGQFNPKYATKVAHTVNALDLKTFDKIYNYWHQMHKTIVSLEKQQKQNIINDEIEWLG